MNGGGIKKAAIDKAKQVATAANNAANGNGGKKRRKGTDLKPIITTDGVQSADSSPVISGNPNNLRLVIIALVTQFMVLRRPLTAQAVPK